MATQDYQSTKFVNVVEPIVDATQNNQQLKMYGSISDNAELKWDPLPFSAFGKIMRTNNKKVSTWIKHYYQQTFHDLKGVYVSYDPSRGIFPVDFFFSKNALPCPEDKIENLIDVTVPNNGHDASRNFFWKKQIIDNRSSGKKYELSDQTKILLSDVTMGGKANGPTNKIWNRPDVVSQLPPQPIYDNSYNSRAFEILIRVGGIFDFRSILRKMFGRTMVVETTAVVDEQGRSKIKNIVARALYEARYIRPIVNNSYEFIMNIEQFDEEQVKKLNLEENPVRMYAPGTIVYY